MIDLQIAGFHIKASGFDTSLFQKRTMEYRCEEAEPDLTVESKFCEHISIPDGKQIACSGERHWLKTETGYAIYDSVWIGKKQTVLASIHANCDWSVVSACLRRVELWGGADSDVRNFNLLGEIFRWFLLCRNGMILHSSCLRCAGKGIAFSAPSGTGKSTHTALWRRLYQTEMINDDSPAIRMTQSGLMLFGTPWSGKSDINHNISAPLSALVFLEQSDSNRISRLSVGQISTFLLRELIRPVYPELLLKTLNFMEQIIKETPSFLLQCTASDAAAKLAHDVLLNEI